jgi:hypothetical protein
MHAVSGSTACLQATAGAERPFSKAVFVWFSTSILLGSLQLQAMFTGSTIAAVVHGATWHSCVCQGHHLALFLVAGLAPGKQACLLAPSVTSAANLLCTLLTLTSATSRLAAQPTLHPLAAVPRLAIVPTPF